MFEYRVFQPSDTPQELFQFRYKIYIEELGRMQHDACHKTKTIKDSLDDTARQVIVFYAGKIIGCIRANLLKHGPVDYYHELYGLDRLSKAQCTKTSICTRLSVAPKYRKHPSVTKKMFQTLYDYGVQNDVELSYLDCYDRLAGFFEKFGYSYLGHKKHYEYGDVAIMRLELFDFDRLIENRTFFAKQAAHYKELMLSSDRCSANSSTEECISSATSLLLERIE